MAWVHTPSPPRLCRRVHSWAALIAAVVCLVSCAGPGSSAAEDATLGAGDATGDAGEAGDLGTVPDGGHPSATLDEVDLRVLTELDALCAAKAPLWPGSTLCSSSVLLIRRSIKGTPSKALVVRPSSAMTGWGPTTRGDVVQLTSVPDVLSPAQTASADVTVGSVSMPAIAYDGALPEPQWAWVAELGAVAMERVRTVDATWATVEGCGRSNYPRVAELIADTFLETTLMAHAATATDAALPDLARDLQAVRAHRIALHPMVGRFDNDAENLQGAPGWGRYRAPVLAQLRPPTEARQAAAKALLASVDQPLDALDDALLWTRPLHTGPLWIDIGERLGWDLAPAYAQGQTAFAAASAALGAPDLSRLPKVRARYDYAGMQARAAALMKR